MKLSIDSHRKPKYPFMLLMAVWLVIGLIVVSFNQVGGILSDDLAMFILIAAGILIPLWIGVNFRVCSGSGKLLRHELVGLELEQVLVLCRENDSMTAYYKKYKDADPTMWACFAWVSHRDEYGFVTELHHCSDDRYSAG